MTFGCLQYENGYLSSTTAHFLPDVPQQTADLAKQVHGMRNSYTHVWTSTYGPISDLISADKA